MKIAAKEDAWRRVGPDWPAGLSHSHLSVLNVPGVEPSAVPLYGGLSILCGGNAAGKTRLLAAVLEFFDTGSTSKVSLTGGPSTSSVDFIDTFWLIQKQRLSLGQDKALQERRDQAGLSLLRSEETRLASYLLGKDYERIEFAELEATDDDQLLIASAPEDPLIRRALRLHADVVPYFKVSRSGLSFDSTQLSQGELAGLTLIWALGRLSSGGTVCIDEPETFMAPLAAQRCLDVLAYFCHKKQLTSFVSSHSYLGLANAPSRHLLLLDPVNSGLVRLKTATDARLWSALRLAPPKPIVFVVEDQAAKQWLLHLLQVVGFANQDCVDIWIGGHKDAVRDAARFPSNMQEARAAFWGVADGDERDAKIRGKQGNLLFLPGDLSAENLILQTIRQGTADLSEIDLDKARACIARHEGENPHDIVANISGELGFTVTVLRHMILGAWLNSTEEGRTAKDSFATSLEQVQLPPRLSWKED